MRGPSPRGPELGPIGDKILFENDRVRIWSVKLDPGQRQAWHKHDLSYVIVPMTEGKNIMYFEDGREKETNETSGGVLWREAGAPHELLNVSDWQYRNILIELK
jgi:quercetin dioxygenase-like cupin family protein